MKNKQNTLYTPTQKILENYAKVLVRFALSGGKGIKKGDVVRLIASESAKPLFIEIRKEIYRAGGHVVSTYLPDDDDRYNASRDFYELATGAQLDFFPEKLLKGMIDQIDHQIYIIAEASKISLHGVDPKKIMRAGKAMKPFIDWRNEKENNGKFTWTIGMYGTQAMADEVGLSLEAYWKEIIKACYLDDKDPIKKWKGIYKELGMYQKKLNALPEDTRLHITGEDSDLWITLGKKRKWVAGSGRNIPSFEIFTSPDWRGTEGWIRFNQPLYRYGSVIKGIQLWFKNGKVVKATADHNEDILKAMIKSPNADKVGEFSLTDKRHSRITQVMGETLYDENMGGPQGNTHIALGNAYHDCYTGDPSKNSKKDWEQLGYNDSPVHTDIISTAKRTVTAHFPDGKTTVIYHNGKFVL
jgi:aminopeptidase